MPMSPRKRRHSVLGNGDATDKTSPGRRRGPHADPFTFHASFGGTLEAISVKLNQYFDQLDLVPHRDFFPAESRDSIQGLAALRRGFRSRMWRNHSLVKSEGNPLPAEWDNAKRRIIIQPKLMQAPSTLQLRQVARQPGTNKLKGFLLSMCIVEHVQAQVVYTPVVGGWIAASSDESYQDRELKGLFSWRALPPLVQQELQCAFLMRLLIDAMWWKVPGGDPSGDSNRFVSIPIEDLVLYPIETIDLLDQMESMAQHFELEDKVVRHSIVKCKCLQYKDSPNTHLLISSNRLRNQLAELSSARQRSTANPIVKSVFLGIPSIRVMQAFQIARTRLKPILVAHVSAANNKPKRHEYVSSDEEP
eukprot:Gregarina_sp_Poly_1__1487@NODE_1372_length_4272_cov_47_282045_g26_i1_p2_GENE_NODE_1372_length_4272_cov_47_282045_g26_i1NODE_1372_length_4272_cov_47_282045_g26_i1_p2_ORF_typecomplete_len362_score46_82_NODE_1372_length_4272_cov_47_282045_g26_i131774262